MSRDQLSGGVRHEIRVERPAFEKRHDDPKRNYGIGCVMMSFAAVGDEGAISWQVFTGWHLPHVAERLRRETRHEAYPHDPKRFMRCSLEGMGGAVDIHSKHPLWEGHEPQTGCRFTGGECWGDTGFSAGDTMFDILVEKGQDALFVELDEWYRVQILGEESTDA